MTCATLVPLGMGVNRGSRGLRVDPAGRLAVLAAAGDGAAKAELVKQMSPLVGRLAGRMASARVPRQDLEQAGAVGVLAAVDAFDADRGTAFAPYAMRYALG